MNNSTALNIATYLIAYFAAEPEEHDGLQIAFSELMDDGPADEEEWLALQASVFALLPHSIIAILSEEA